MKRFVAFASAVALSLLVVGAQAQKPSPGKMGGGMGAPGMMKPPGNKGVIGTSVGTVKGAPTAKGFTLTTAKGDVTVDTSNAKYRNASGQFVKADKLTSGASVEATGAWRGRALFAENVKITSLKADKPSGGKMGGKMTGGGAATKK